MIRLASHSKVPPGQFWYEQTFTVNGQGYTKRWASTPEIGTLAVTVAGFRRKNGLERHEITEALEDIDTFTVNRLPSGSKWLHDTDRPWPDIVASFHGPGCATCGKKT